MITDAQALVAVELAKHDPAALARVMAMLEEEPEPAFDHLYEAAIAYAKAGIPVFPLKPGQKVPATRHGFKDATAAIDDVAFIWSDNPDYNIGLPTGYLFDVIDIDGPAGYRSLLELRDSGAVPEIIGKVLTARCGQHLYIKPTGDGNAAGVLEGIDFRGRSGYVVAPPSYSSTTRRRWTWVDPLDLATP